MTFSHRSLGMLVVALAALTIPKTASAQQQFASGAISFVYPTGWNVTGTDIGDGIELRRTGTLRESPGRVQLFRDTRPQGGTDDAVHFAVRNYTLPRVLTKVRAVKHAQHTPRVGTGMTSRLVDGANAEVGALATIISNGSLYFVVAITDDKAEMSSLATAHRMILDSLRIDGSRSRQFEALNAPQDSESPRTGTTELDREVERIRTKAATDYVLGTVRGR